MCPPSPSLCVGCLIGCIGHRGYRQRSWILCRLMVDIFTISTICHVYKWNQKTDSISGLLAGDYVIVFGLGNKRLYCDCRWKKLKRYKSPAAMWRNRRPRMIPLTDRPSNELRLLTMHCGVVIWIYRTVGDCSAKSNKYTIFCPAISIPTAYLFLGLYLCST